MVEVTSSDEDTRKSIMTGLSHCNNFARLENPEGYTATNLLAMGSCLPVFDPFTNSSIPTFAQIANVNNQTIPEDTLACIKGRFQQDCPQQPIDIHRGGPSTLQTYLNIGISGALLAVVFLFVLKMCHKAKSDLRKRDSLFYQGSSDHGQLKEAAIPLMRQDEQEHKQNKKTFG